MDNLLKGLLWWVALTCATVGSVSVGDLSQRLDVTSPSSTLATDALIKLVDISRAVCLHNANVLGCHVLDGSLGRGVNDATLSRLQSVDGISDLASLFILHMSYIQEQHNKMVLEKNELEEKLRAMEAFNLQLMEGNMTEAKMAAISGSLGVSSSVGHHSLYSPTAIALRPTDCADHLLLGATKSGVYDIFPFSCKCSQPVKVWCDMETEGGGWTTFFSRDNITIREDFNRSWNEYGSGFGNASGEYFLGTDNLHVMTSNRQYRLRVEFELPDGTAKFSEWDVFYVSDRANKYKLSVGTFLPHSMTTDCLSSQINNMFFSTVDYDNDRTNNNCALNYQSGWWYNACGLFTPGYVMSNGHIQTHCPYVANGKKLNIEATKIQLKIRPKICGKRENSAHFNTHTCKEYNFLH
ncbi:techylectin-5A-like isoform X2 [Penaeus japonicus]|uniref:techylectin-5A-like isoform X2 n=1 Tax=Penaeus japonicus TaxID=27405 RepID=UPI001C70D6FC|nr:techylectin-5A-like isoform X2 [Penaeus japonicus]